jgi:hypothetical protein
MRKRLVITFRGKICILGKIHPFFAFLTFCGCYSSGLSNPIYKVRRRKRRGEKKNLGHSPRPLAKDCRPLHTRFSLARREKPQTPGKGLPSSALLLVCFVWF